MNENYLSEKQKKRYESLLAWKQFYLECSNEYEATKVGYKIERFEAKHFGE